MTYTTLVIARRFMRTITAKKNIRTMLAICCISIAVGTFALALVAAIMSGIEKATYTKLQGIHSDITMQSCRRAPLAFDKIKQTLTKKFPAIISAAPIMEQHAIIQTSDSQDISHVVLIQGIDPAQDSTTRTLATMVKSPETLDSALKQKQILIGTSLAHALDVEIGETIILLHSDNEQKRSKMSFEQSEVSIGGFFETGIDEFDATTIFCSTQTFAELFPDKGIVQIALKVSPSSDIKQTIATLKKYFNLDVFSWQELYQPLMSALALEKYGMIIILLLVSLVASMNIVALLLMYIAQKRSSIALFLAMGMPTSMARNIFVVIGNAIALGSGILGLIGACIASWLLETHHLITLPDMYYTTHLPADMSWSIIFGVFSVVCIISFFATLIATRSIKQISIAQILKFES